jgi:hypothetical protein
MKTLIISLTLLFSFQASAGFGWLLLGAAMSGSNKSKTVVYKTEFEIKLDQVKKMLPSSCSFDQSVYSSCWKNYKQPVVTVHVDQTTSDQMMNYFKNLGYKVRLEGSQLSFNFEEEHKKYLAHQQVFMSFESMLISLLLLSVGLYIWHLRRRYHKKVVAIKLAYENNKNDLLFHDKYDQKKFEESLNKLTIPSSWNPIVKDDKLVRITYYDGRSGGVIASSMTQWAKQLIPLSKMAKSLGPTK